MTRERVPAVLLAPLFLLALSRWLAHDALLPLVWASSITPWLYLPAYPLLVYAGVKKRVPLGAAALFVVVSHLAWVAPSVVPRAEPIGAQGPALRVVTANLLAVNPEPQRLLDELLETDADVLMLQEVTPRWAAVLGEVEGYPHRRIEPSPDAFGIAILSQRPLRSVSVRDLGGVPMLDAVMEHQGRAVRVFAVHTLPPYSPAYADVWRAQLASLAERVRSTHGPVVVAGDLNATTHHAGLQGLVDRGLVDVHEARGRGLSTTWPNGVFPLPPLRLDHVLVSEELHPRRVWEGRGSGSDHQPVVVDLVWSRGAPSAAVAAR